MHHTQGPQANSETDYRKKTQTLESLSEGLFYYYYTFAIDLSLKYAHQQQSAKLLQRYALVQKFKFLTLNNMPTHSNSNACEICLPMFTLLHFI